MYFRLKNIDKNTNKIAYDVILETTKESHSFKVIKIIKNDNAFGSKEGEKVFYSDNFLKNIAKNKYIKYEVTYYKDKNDFLEYLI
jgi:hypothetical protein